MITTEDWVRVEKEALQLIIALELQLIHANLMLNRAKMEIVQAEDNAKKR